jgi:diaminohydroxyphosphoribosylaminopyrimidine deaminase/5-amino-6-(5-phosphoribosylamino)uracil reductase
MRRALQLAARGRGRTSPNPMVGATIVAPDGTIVGDGWHQQAGTPHAEIHAIRAAGDKARGATLVCTLEPCCHHGRTGPCTDAIIAAGITQVVAAVDDPNPHVAGQGFARLEQHGIHVTRGVGRMAAATLNRAFFMAMRERRPWVVMKAGTSADGRASRRRSQRLRAELDAIAVGVDTVLVDDPTLTVRELYRPRPLVRVVFDRRLRTPPASRLFDTLDAGPVWVATTTAAIAERAAEARALEAAGAVLVPTGGGIAEALRALTDRGLLSLLVEGGPRLHAAFWDAGMIDEVQVFVAPDRFLPDGVPMTPGAGPVLCALDDFEAVPVGDDVLVRGYVHRPH